MSSRFAYLTYSNRRYIAYDPTGVSPLDDTPVIRLIESVWDQYPQQAFHLLRSRIFANYSLSARCRGAVQLAAKRISEALNKADLWQQTPEDILLPPPVQAKRSFIPPNHSSSSSDLAKWIKAFQFPTSDRPILAVLTDQNGHPILAATNTSSSNRIRHAEVNLVREYVQQKQRKIPQGYQIWVSLKPCRMCSSFIHELSEDGTNTIVRYLEDDPGPKARNSLLHSMKQYRSDQD